MKLNIGIIIILCGIFNLPSNLFAQKKFCIIPEISYSSIKGIFDGETALVGENSTFVLPKLKGNLGYGVSLGIIDTLRFPAGSFIGIRYARTQYDGLYFEEDIGQAINNLIGFEVKVFLPQKRKDYASIKSKVQFFVSSGLEFGFLKVKEAVIKSQSYYQPDFNMISFDVPIGVGITITPIKTLSINFDAGYRLAGTLRITQDFAESLDTGHNYWMGGFNCNLGLCFNLFPKAKNFSNISK